ncbi:MULTISPECIES: hypothetical protein [Serratia]|uniref:hypothetical protein n=1 Tax=Serratia TaxID=613 RepID=UPI000661268C|nr:hypothetical protein [Serratia sp. 506_PEND]
MAYLRRELPPVATLCLIGVLCAGIWGMHQQVEGLKHEAAQLRQARDAARLALDNQQRTLRFFDTLSKAAIDDKQRNTRRSEAERAASRADLAAVPAAHVVVPAAVADRVRAAADEIRAGSTAAAAR